MQSLLKERSHRETLQEIGGAIANKLMECEKRKGEFMSYVSNLDAWDKRRIDEPHYDKRHCAYQNLLEVCVFLLLRIIFNLCFSNVGFASFCSVNFDFSRF